jgi:hypothetical protein
VVIINEFNYMLIFLGLNFVITLYLYCAFISYFSHTSTNISVLILASLPAILKCYREARDEIEFLMSTRCLFGVGVFRCI